MLSRRECQRRRSVTNELAVGVNIRSARYRTNDTVPTSADCALAADLEPAEDIFHRTIARIIISTQNKIVRTSGFMCYVTSPLQSIPHDFDSLNGKVSICSLGDPNDAHRIRRHRSDSWVWRDA